MHTLDAIIKNTKNVQSLDRNQPRTSPIGSFWWLILCLLAAIGQFLFPNLGRSATIPGYMAYDFVGTAIGGCSLPTGARPTDVDIEADSQGNIYILDLFHSTLYPWQSKTYPLQGGRLQPQPNLWLITPDGSYSQYMQPRFIYRTGFTYGAYNMTSIAIDAADNLLFNTTYLPGNRWVAGAVMSKPLYGREQVLFTEPSGGSIEQIQVDSKGNIVYFSTRFQGRYIYEIKQRAPNGTVTTLVTFPSMVLSGPRILGFDKSDNLYYTDRVPTPPYTTILYQRTPKGIVSTINLSLDPATKGGTSLAGLEFSFLHEGPNGKLYIGAPDNSLFELEPTTGLLTKVSFPAVTNQQTPKSPPFTFLRNDPCGTFTFGPKGSLYYFSRNGRLVKFFDTTRISNYTARHPNNANPAVDVQLFPLSATASKPANIKMIFSATNSWIGTPITGLTRNHFSLNVDGINALVPEAFFDIHPLSVKPSSFRNKKVIMFDISSSITPADLAAMKKTVINMLVDVNGKSRLQPGETVSIWAFDDIVRLKQNFTNNTALLVKAINGLRIGGASTNLYGAVVTGMKTISTTYKNGQLNVGQMIVVTDGGDTAGIKSMAQAKASVGKNSIYFLLTGIKYLPATVLQNLTAIAGSKGHVVQARYFYYTLNGRDLAFDTAMNQIRLAANGYPKSLYVMEYVTPLRGFGQHTATLAVKNNYNNTVANVYFNPGKLGFRNPTPALTIFGPDLLAPQGTVSLEGVTKYVSPLTAAHTWSIDKPAVASIKVNPTNPSIVTVTANPGQSGFVTVTLRDTTYPRLVATHTLFISDVGLAGMNSMGQKVIIGLKKSATFEALTASTSLPPKYVWTVANPAIAKVNSYSSSQYADIWGMKAGTTQLTITDTANGKSFTTTITVKKSALKLARPILLKAQPLRGKIKVLWRNNVKGERGYFILRRQGPRGAFRRIGRVKMNTTIFLDRKVRKGAKYFYKIFAYKGKIKSPYSRVVSARAK